MLKDCNKKEKINKKSIGTAEAAYRFLFERLPFSNASALLIFERANDDHYKVDKCTNTE
jgi:hypothetical protein